jgi:predicted NBD/HSP70 family sugar kinase
MVGSAMEDSLLLVAPRVAPPLHPEFRPAALAFRAMSAAVRAAGGGQRVVLAVERTGGVARFETAVLPDGHAGAGENLRFVERILKMLLWQKGGFRVYVSGPAALAAGLAAEYAPGGARAFDAEFMAKVYEKPAFEVLHVSESELPAENEAPAPVGGHLGGCRIGFDAGGSDRKVAAVIDGKEVFATEVVWHPKVNSDAQYHIDGIEHSMRLAAEHLPRVDAVGVSSAGIYVDNRTMVASLFRKIPEADFEARIKNVYLDVPRRLFGDVPVAVCNDGDVTALAGAMSLGDRPVLGIAMGTSEAVGYVNQDGLIMGWLNELAFAPVDYSPEGGRDVEWSGDVGVGCQYFSQDAVIRLAPRAGIELDPSASPGAKLKAVQELMNKGDPRPRGIYESIGVYLGYALIHYALFYEVKHVLLLGRVTSGEGGSLLVGKAAEVLALEAPELAARLALHLPDEASRRVGQSIAAASLPALS